MTHKNRQKVKEATAAIDSAPRSVNNVEEVEKEAAGILCVKLEELD